jgi:hypothetical protein
MHSTSCPSTYSPSYQINSEPEANNELTNLLDIAISISPSIRNLSSSNVSNPYALIAPKKLAESSYSGCMQSTNCTSIFSDRQNTQQYPQPANINRRFCPAIEAIFEQAKEKYQDSSSSLEQPKLSLSHSNSIEKTAESPKISSSPSLNEIEESEFILSPINIQPIQDIVDPVNKKKRITKPIDETISTKKEKVKFKRQVVKFIKEDIKKNCPTWSQITYFHNKFNIKLDLKDRSILSKAIFNIHPNKLSGKDKEIVKLWFKRDLEPDWNRFFTLVRKDLLKYFPVKQFYTKEDEFFTDSGELDRITHTKYYFYTVVEQLKMLPFCKSDEDVLNYSLSKLQIVNTEQKTNVTEAINTLLKNKNLFPAEYHEKCLSDATFNFNNKTSVNWSKFYYCLGIKL